MQIHELNPFQGTLGSEAFLVVDNGDDTGKISVERLTQPINDRIDDIITSPAPTEQEIIDARRGWNEVVYGSLGTAIRSQVKQILAQFYKFNTYDLLGVYGTPISRTRNGVTFTWDEAGQVCDVSGEAVGGDAYASIYTQTGAWQGIFERGVTYTIGYETTDPNVKLRIAVWEGVETTPDYYYFDENGHFGIPPEAAKIGVDLWVESGDSVSAVVKNVYMLRTYTAEEVTATIRDAMIGADLHMYNSLGDAIREQLNGKVDKVTGKGLSTNDFTDADKTKLDDIEAGAEVNAIEAIKLDGTELTPDENRAVDIPVDDTLTEAGTPADAKAVGDELEKKANTDGYYETFTSGQTNQLIATEAITDTEPYIYRKTGGANDVGDRVYDTIVGGSVVWNQLVKELDDTGWRTESGVTATYADGVATVSSTVSANGIVTRSNVTLVQGHKYFLTADIKAEADISNVRIGSNTITNVGMATTANTTWKTVSSIKECSRTESQPFMLYVTGSAYQNLYVKNYVCINLTAALTPEVADHIYTLEQANAGAGVAYFKKYFPEEYHEFCEPHFEHVQTSAKITVGFNQFDFVGSNVAQGDFTNPSSVNNVHTDNFVDVLGNTTYYYKQNTAMHGVYIRGYDEYGNYTFGTIVSKYNDATKAFTFTTPEGCRYIKILWYRNTGLTPSVVRDDEVCLNISGDRDGEYEAYRKRTYPIEPKVLRGVPKLDSANRLYFDGDIYRHDGTYIPRYREFDLGSVGWTKIDVGGYTVYYTGLSFSPTTANFGVFCEKYVTSEDLTYSTDKIIEGHGSSAYNFSRIYIRDDSASTPEELRASLNGVKAIIEIGTPTTETAEPYQYPMVVDPLGTEEFVDYAVEQGDRDVAIPVGHNSEYPADLRGKLQHLPSLASADGRYVVVQSGRQMSLTPDTSLGLIAALEARVAALEGGNG